MEKLVARMPRSAVRKEGRAETLKISALRSVTTQSKDIIEEAFGYCCLRRANHETGG
jgi:hypothetical protein